VAGSGKYNDIGCPFGYLKASSTNQVVNLVVMPYNYPLLVPLLGICLLFTYCFLIVEEYVVVD